MSAAVLRLREWCVSVPRPLPIYHMLSRRRRRRRRECVSKLHQNFSLQKHKRLLFLSHLQMSHQLALKQCDRWSDGFFVRHPEAVVAPLGDEAALKCVLRFPAERLRWRKDGRLLPPPNATADAAAAAQHAHPHAHAHAHPHQGP
ncbi:Protein of unknown function, partial [Gryllus bimaculatus]